MFNHPDFDKYSFKEIPIDRDIYLVDKKWMAAYEQSMLNLFNKNEYEAVGYVSPVAVRKINPDSMEISWFANSFDRFHELVILLPKDKIVLCVGSAKWDEKPRIFVDTDWLESLHLRAYSLFSWVDAIGVKKALVSGALTQNKLIELRKKFDVVAEEYPDVSFISFADTVLLKSNWFVGQHNSEVKYNYNPESFFKPVLAIRRAYRDILDLDSYAVFTQGSNEFYKDGLLHISDKKNHVSLNSLGLPFAQLISIDDAVRKAIRAGVHEPKEFYMDGLFYKSLQFKGSEDKDKHPRNIYKSPMTGEDSFYYHTKVDTLLLLLQNQLTVNCQ